MVRVSCARSPVTANYQDDKIIDQSLFNGWSLDVYVPCSGAPDSRGRQMIVKDNVRVGDVGAPQSLYRYAANANLYHLIDAHYPPHTVRVVGGA